MNAAMAQGVTAQEYLDRVRAALADLPADERDELLEDLPAHLADVAAESDGALEERLGSPEEYAAELRASAGLAPPQRATTTRRFSDFSAAMQQWPAWQRFRAFAPSLRPGWWVLRGYIAALAIAVATTDVGHYGLSAELSDDLLLFLPFAALVIWASVTLGKRSSGWRGPRRAAVYGLNIFVVIVALGMATVATTPRVDEVTYYSNDPGQESSLNYVDDVYAYDSAGRPLTDVRLYDRFGNPIVLPGQPMVRERADGSGVDTNVYPRGQYETPPDVGYQPNELPPANVPPLLPRPPVAVPSTSPSTSASPSPVPSASPSVIPSASPAR